MTELTSIQLRTGRILSARNMITEFGLESIGYPLQSSGYQPASAMQTPDTSPRREAAGTQGYPLQSSGSGVDLQAELTTEHPTRSLAADETIETPQPVHRRRADDQLVIEPAQPSRSDGYPTPTHPSYTDRYAGPQLPSLATVPIPTSDDTSDVEVDRMLPRRQATPQVPPRPTAVQRQTAADGAAPVPHTIPRRADGERDVPLPPVVPERSEVRESRLLARTSARIPDEWVPEGHGEGENTVDSRSNHGEPPASNPLSTTSSPLDNLSALSMADTAVQGAAGRMSGKRRQELAQIESAVHHSRQRELRIDSGR